MIIIKKFAYIVIVIIAFAVSISVGNKLAVAKYEKEHYGYLNVKWNKSVGTIVSNLSYGGKELNNYDLYLPAGKKEEYSMILFIHGGGFMQGDKTDAKWIGKYYASKGYVVASVNYSLNEVGADYKLTEKNDEIRQAFSAIISETDKRGYHLKDFAVTGDSAGGYLSLMLALREPESLEIPVKFAFVTSAPACFEPVQWNAKEPDEQIDFMSSMCGKKLEIYDVSGEAFMEIVKGVSPDRWVNENSCPLILAYGTNDKIVPVNLKYHLMEALDENSVEYIFIEFPNSGHGLAGDNDKLQEYYRTVDQYVERFLQNEISQSKKVNPSIC